MEVTELTLWIARFGVLALMYLLILVLVFAMRADARAASLAPRQMLQPSPNPTPSTAPMTSPTSTPTPQVRTLVVVSGSVPTGGREYQLFGPIEIGRSSTCMVSLPNNFVSSRHARIFQENGQWLVEDLGSTNGTVLNGQPLLTPKRLNPGDKLLIGDTEFVIK